MKSEIKFKNNKLDYFLVYLIIVFSNPSSFWVYYQFLIVLAFIIVVALFFIRKLTFDKLFYYYVLFLLVMVGFQTWEFEYFDFVSTIGLFLRFTYPYFTLKIVGSKFTIIYTQIIYFFSIISFIFYLPAAIFPGFNDLLFKIPELLGTDPISNEYFILYNVEALRGSILRNPGPTYEPGAFAAILMLALMFESLNKNTLFTKKNIIFILALITTYSTTGYIALFVYIVGYYLIIKNNLFYYFISIVFMLIGTYLFFNLEFLNEKIVNQIELTENKSYEYENEGRIGSAIVDLRQLSGHPFFGVGRSDETRWGNIRNFDKMELHRTNGITDFALKYGLIGFLVLIILMYKSFKEYCFAKRVDIKFAFILLITILILSFSQIWLSRELFLSFAYLSIIFTKNRRNVEISSTT